MTGVRLADPDTGTIEELKYQIRPNAVEFIVPEVRIYRIVVVSITT
ncbi:MAG: hypothetical protein ACKV22_22245 [Bryobacteraceae bacterium]